MAFTINNIPVTTCYSETINTLPAQNTLTTGQIIIYRNGLILCSTQDANKTLRGYFSYVARSNFGGNIYNLNAGNVGIGVQNPNRKLTISGGSVLSGGYLPWNVDDTTINHYITPLNNSNICSIAVS